MEERMERAKQLLAEIHHIPIATVNEDGSPHSSPVFMAFDTTLCGYWASHQQAQHSQNIQRDGDVFLVIFDSREGHGGLYIKAVAKVLEGRAEVEKALEILSSLKEKMYGSMGAVDDYIDDAPQRLYKATPTNAWLNKSERNAEGVIIRDVRFEVPLTALAK
jgi:uncharacterized pyridoxamine 5'-phosphate oxidase family protein